MQIDDISLLDDSYDLVYLSPHLDDAVLSCGGAMGRDCAAGKRVLVVAICTAAPPPEGPFNSIAQELHRNWGLDAAEVVTTRLREDRRAMELLGCDSYHAGLLDAIYRYPDAYDTRETLFGVPAGDDPLLPELKKFVRDLRERVPQAMLHAPLGVGSHVDHQITYAAASASSDAEVLFYEDFPYAATAGAVDARLQQLGIALSPRTVDISGTLAQKIDAIAAYASQLDELFGGREAMARAASAYSRSILPGGCVERLWTRE